MDTCNQQLHSGCPQPIENAIEVEIVDQFLRYDRYGYAIRIRVDPSKNPQPNKRFALALNLHSLRYALSFVTAELLLSP